MKGNLRKNKLTSAARGSQNKTEKDASERLTLKTAKGFGLRGRKRRIRGPGIFFPTERSIRGSTRQPGTLRKRASRGEKTQK